ncbi:MAG TPA: protein-disulfide reductase DsbD domain-containing protein [Candidatus Limnocylindria bacterium]|nr:protein-disulfide reductase DsbD domain-containing protein [Candidatus Limnocylindria bacterium]
MRAWIDSPTYYTYQRLGLHLELRVAPGWHIYGPAVPAGYQRLDIAVRSEPPGAHLGAIRWPRPMPFRVTGLAEDFAVYEGFLRLAIPIEFVIPRGSGTVRLEVEIRSQACSTTECLPPASVRATIPIPEAPTL